MFLHNFSSPKYMIFRSDHTRWQVRYDDYSTKPCLPLISISLQFSYSLYSVILEFSFVNNLSYRFLTIWFKWGRNWKIGSFRVWREKKMTFIWIQKDLLAGNMYFDLVPEIHMHMISSGSCNSFSDQNTRSGTLF